MRNKFPRQYKNIPTNAHNTDHIACTYTAQYSREYQLQNARHAARNAQLAIRNAHKSITLQLNRVYNIFYEHTFCFEKRSVSSL